MISLDPEQDEQQPSPDELVVVEWRQALESPETLQPGNLICDLESMQVVDLLIHNLGRLLSGLTPAHELPGASFSSSGKQVYNGWYSASRPPSRVIEPKGFLGKLRNITVLMLNDSPLNQVEHKDSSSPPNKNLFVLATKHSSGKGQAGHVALRCSVGIIASRRERTPGTPGLISVHNEIYSAQSAEKIADAVKPEKNTQFARDVVLHGLEKAIKGLFRKNTQSRQEHPQFH